MTPPATRVDARSTGREKGSTPRSPAQVVFDGRYVNDRYHGIGRYAYHLVAELVQALPSIHFTVLRDPDLTDSRFDWPLLLRAPNVHIEAISAAPFSLVEQSVVPRVLLNPGTQLYHTPYFALPWLMPARSIITVHDCIFEHDPRYMPKRWARLYYKLLMRASLRRAYAVAVPSEATAKDLRQFYKVSRRKVIVTPEAADKAFRPVADPESLEGVRGRYKLPERFILAVGARRPHKNFEVLVCAFARLNAVDASLVFVGEADERFPDTTVAAARALGDRVRFLGRVPEADLPAIYSLATGFAAPSLIEGFGLPVLEAMSCGVPVVCSDIPVFREVAGDAAMMAPPSNVEAWASALGKVLLDAGLRDRMRDAGLERAATFAWSKAARPLLPVYRKVLS